MPFVVNALTLCVWKPVSFSLAVLFHVVRVNVVFFSGTIVGGILTRRALERKAKAAGQSAALARYADASPEDVRKLLGAPLPWMTWPEWQVLSISRKYCTFLLTSLSARSLAQHPHLGTVAFC